MLTNGLVLWQQPVLKKPKFWRVINVSNKQMKWQDTWIYKSGDLWLPKPIVDLLHMYIIGDDTTTFFFTIWHIMHFLSGVFFGVVYRFFPFPTPFVWYFILHTVWEAWQIFIGMTPQTLRGAVDIVTDTSMGLLGVFVVLTLF